MGWIIFILCYVLSFLILRMFFKRLDNSRDFADWLGMHDWSSNANYASGYSHNQFRKVATVLWFIPFVNIFIGILMLGTIGVYKIAKSKFSLF